MKAFNLYLIFLVSAGFSAQVASEPLADESNTVLIPLAVGNTWTYKGKGKEGTIKYSRVEKKQMVNGVTWFLYNEFGDRFWVRNQGAKQYEAFDSFNTDAIEQSRINQQLILSEPDGKEKTYVVGYDRVTYSPCAKPISVSAGTFDCHKYKFDLGNNYYSISYYAKGVGLILNKYTIESGYSEFELLEYKLK